MATVPYETSDELDRRPAPRQVVMSRRGEDATANRRATSVRMTIRKLTPGPIPPEHIHKVVAAALVFSREQDACGPVLVKAPPQSVSSRWTDQARALTYAERVVRGGSVNAGLRQGRLL